MANQPSQSAGGTNQDKSAQQTQAQPNQGGQQGQVGKPQDQQQQTGGNKAGQQDQQGQKGHPPGATQGDNPNQQSGGSKSQYGTSDGQRRQTFAPNATGAECIDTGSDEALRIWAERLNVSQDQIREAVEKVGDRSSDVELHLKGSRSTTNDDRVEAAE